MAPFMVIMVGLGYILSPNNRIWNKYRGAFRRGACAYPLSHFGGEKMHRNLILM